MTTNNNKSEGERLVKIETDISYIKKAMEKVEHFIEGADERYADKNIEHRVNSLEVRFAKYAGICIGVVAIIQIIFQLIK